MISLQTRLLVASALVLLSFLTLTGFILNDVFSRQIEEAIKERLISFSNNIYLASIVTDVESNDSNDNAGLTSSALSANTATNNVADKRDNKDNSRIDRSIDRIDRIDNSTIALNKNDFDPKLENAIANRKTNTENVSETISADIGTPQRALSSQAFYDKHSGLYAQIIDYNNQISWRSVSIDDDSIPFNYDTRGGGYSFKVMNDSLGEKFFALSYTVILEKKIKNKLVEHRYIFQVSESLDRAYNIQLDEFQAQLIKWMSALTIVLLVSLVFILRWWGLGPIHKVSKELEDIKSGRAHNLSGLYPQELLGLTDSIKTLIVSERAQQQRYRNSLGDLAHSLKTPLAVLSTVSVNDKNNIVDIEKNIKEQITRMRQIVDYQLQRAAASGRTTLMTPVSVAHSVDRIVNTLSKAYSEKSIKFIKNIDERAMFIGDEGDLLELLGNIIDNACKMCQQIVAISVQNQRQMKQDQLLIEVEDDGPGIPEDRIQVVLKRGFRVDESSNGQGIGLAVVKEIVHAYKGSLDINKSVYGGAKFSMIFNHD